MQIKKINLLLAGALLLLSFFSNAQSKFFTKSGKISFLSSTPAEEIKALNKSAAVVFDTKTGNIQFSVLMKGFEFRKALMQEHFNEKYVESDKFPKAEFIGQVTNNTEINYSKNGDYTAKVKGKLTIHGETKEIETTGTIVVKDGKIEVNSVFNLLIADYKISIPAVVRDSIEKSIKITVDCSLDPLSQ